jgi:hypothetical protein
LARTVQNRPVLRVALAALVTVLACVAAGCGGGGGGGTAGGTPPDKYADAVCGAIVSWQNDLKSSVSSMTSSMSGVTSPAQIKAKLVEFTKQAVALTHTMIAKVKAAGPPDIKNGDQLQKDVENGLAQAEAAFAQARDSAKSLPANDPAAFQREAVKLGNVLSKQGTAIQTTFDSIDTKYNSKDLNEAFTKDAACKNLGA